MTARGGARLLGGTRRGAWPRAAVAVLVAFALRLAMPPLAAEEPAVFDPVTGMRVARYRAPVDSVPAGATRIGIDDLDRLVREEGAALVDVMPAEGGGPHPGTGRWNLVKPRQNIPGSVWLADVGRGRLSPEVETYFRDGLNRITQGDKARALIVYCQSDCWMAWNALRRAASWGYSRLYWYPEGSDGWRDDDRPLADAEPVPLVLPGRN